MSTTKVRLAILISNLLPADEAEREGASITRSQIERNRSILNALRKVVGPDWVFLEDNDIEDILRKNGYSDVGSRKVFFTWNS